VRRIVEIMPITGAGVTLISESTSPHYVAASDSGQCGLRSCRPCSTKDPASSPIEPAKQLPLPTSKVKSDSHSSFRRPFSLDSPRSSPFRCTTVTPSSARSTSIETCRVHLDETPWWLAQTLADVASAYLVNAQARSDLLNSAAHAQATALHDALTGLPNRVLLLERIQHALLSRRRSGKLVAVLFIDLDGFKKVNDNSGHQVGDDLLVAVSSRLTDMLRPGDTLARLSGDEFVIVCGDLNEEGQIEGLATRLDAAFARHSIWRSRRGAVGEHRHCLCRSGERCLNSSCTKPTLRCTR
jgi:diguanylate cyclase (GGDEF)-like protein